MKNRSMVHFDDETIREVTRVVNTFLNRYAIFFGSLVFDDLMQECLVYFYVQKKRYWKKAKAAGMSKKNYIVKNCYNCLNHILRDLSSKGRGEAAIAHRDFGDQNSVGFNDAGDLAFIENLFASGVVVDVEGNMILQEACLRVYESLNETGKKVFVLMVNDHLNAAEISRELGYAPAYICMVMKVIREKAFNCFYCPEKSTAITEQVTSQGFC